MSSDGRVFRYVEGTWRPRGDPLPEFAHAPIQPTAQLATWVLPVAVSAQAGDVIVATEVAHRLLMSVPPGDDAWQTVATQAGALAPADEVRAWLAEIELWLGQRLPSGVAWPLPR